MLLVSWRWNLSGSLGRTLKRGAWSSSPLLRVAHQETTFGENDEERLLGDTVDTSPVGHVLTG